MSNEIRVETGNRVLSVNFSLTPDLPHTRWGRFIYWIKNKTFPIRNKLGWFIGVEERLYMSLAEKIRKEIDKEILDVIMKQVEEK